MEASSLRTDVSQAQRQRHGGGQARAEESRRVGMDGQGIGPAHRMEVDTDGPPPSPVGRAARAGEAG